MSLPLAQSTRSPLAKTAPHVEHFREHGYVIVRGLFDAAEMAEAQREAARVYALGLQHHATWRHKNLLYEILPESYAGRRCMLQAHWYAWVSPYFERMWATSACPTTAAAPS